MDALATLAHLPLRFSRNPVAFTIDAVSDSIMDRAQLLYYVVLKKPKAYGSGEFDELITLPGRELPKRSELGSDVWPGAEFDAAIFLDDFLKRTPPTVVGRSIVLCAELITPFLVQTRVENAGVVVAGTAKTLPLEYVLKGSLSVDQFAAWQQQFFTSYLADSRRFLSWQPAEKTIDVAQPEWLYFLVNFTPKPTELQLRMKVFYTDKSQETITVQKITTVSQYSVYSFPVGFSAVGLPEREASFSKTVQLYQIWISNEAGERVSEVKAYWVNREYEANTLYLVFANSLGGYDTFRATGQTSRSLTAKGTPAQRTLSPNYLPSSAELFSLNRSGEKVINVATGLLDGDRIDYLSELTLTDEIYVVTQEGLVSLLPTDTALELRTDEEDLAGRILSYRYAKNEVGYSELPTPPSTPARATMWVPVNTFCLIDDNGKRTGYLGAAKLELRYVDDNTRVKPLRSKANTPGTEGYVAPTVSAVCNSTPFTNLLIEKPGSFRRNDCGADSEATVATLTIPAGTYGGETADQLQSRIDAALKAMDTQAYANQFGSCLTNPANYTIAVPANHFHFRTNVPARIGIETAYAPYMGNAWTMQGRGPSYIFAPGSNDLDFPTTSFDGVAWRFFTYGTAGTSGRLRIYKNGVMYRDVTFVYNIDGYEYHNLFYQPDGSTVLATSGDRLYVQLTDS